MEHRRCVLMAILAVLVIVLAAATYYTVKYTVKIAVKSVTPMAAGFLTIVGTTTSAIDPTAWMGHRIWLDTKSLGKIRTTVAAATATGNVVTITTIPGAYTGSAAYAMSDGDCARVFLR